jgi:hypothetical protein
LNAGKQCRSVSKSPSIDVIRPESTANDRAGSQFNPATGLTGGALWEWHKSRLQSLALSGF